MSGDDELITLAKRGDADAWRALYRAHAGRLLVWLGTRPSSDSAVSPEDLAAEAWLVAAEKVAGFTGTSQEFAGWLFGIARKLGSNVHRRSARRNTHATDLDGLAHHPTVAGPETAYAAEDWVRRALDLLPRREREVIACREVVGLDVEATAAALGLRVGAVRVAHHRGLRRLRAAGVTGTPEATPAPAPAR